MARENTPTSNNVTQPSVFSLNPKTVASKVAKVKNSTVATDNNRNGDGGVVGSKVTTIA